MIIRRSKNKTIYINESLQKELKRNEEIIQDGFKIMKKNMETNIHHLQNISKKLRNQYEEANPVFSELKKLVTGTPNQQEQKLYELKAQISFIHLQEMSEQIQFNPNDTCQFIFNYIFLPKIKEHFIKTIKNLLAEKTLQLGDNFQKFIQDSQLIIKEITPKIIQSSNQIKSIQELLQQNEKLSPEKLIELELLNLQNIVTTMRQNLALKTSVNSIEEPYDQKIDQNYQKMKLQNLEISSILLKRMQSSIIQSQMLNFDEQCYPSQEQYSERSQIAYRISPF